MFHKHGKVVTDNDASRMNKPQVENTNLDVRQIVNIATQSLVDSAACKQALLNNPYHTTLFEILLERKSSFAINLSRLEEASDHATGPNTEMLRLDNMLAAEGVTISTDAGFPCNNYNVDAVRAGSYLLSTNSGADITSNADHDEYDGKLTQIRQFYNDEYEQYMQQSDIIISHAKTLLDEHSKIRPVGATEQHRLIRAMQRKCNVMPLQLKQTTCEMVMQLRSRLLDARRKRRNFSKHATQILNQYFSDHLSNPYPSEETKENLARQCNVTVAQVSNWFGNKRIRFKKNLGREPSGCRPSTAAANNIKRAAGDDADPAAADVELSSPDNAGERKANKKGRNV